MKNCYVLVGLPASGKSTIVKEMCDTIDAAIYSTDAIIEQIAFSAGKTYDQVFFGND